MNRLQKKCLIATAGFHLLLVIILIVGPGFFKETTPPDNVPMLEMIPSTSIPTDATSGVANAKPPAPQPVVTPPPQPVITPPPPPQPKPDVTPPPAPQLEKTFTEKVKEIFTPEPVKPDPDPEPTPKPVKTKPIKPATKTKPHEVKVDLTKTTTTAKADDTAQKAADEARRQRQEARQAAQARADAFRAVTKNLEKNFTSSTKVEMPGTSSVSYAGYASKIKTIYTQAWQKPKNAANDEATATVSITVSSDGTVISSKIIDRSGDADVDASVQRTLDRVTFIGPFPDGSTESTKTFIIDFNLKAKRMFG